MKTVRHDEMGSMSERRARKIYIAHTMIRWKRDREQHIPSSSAAAADAAAAAAARWAVALEYIDADGIAMLCGKDCEN